MNKEIQRNNNLEEAHLHSRSSSTIPGRVGIWKCWFLRRGENRSTRRNHPPLPGKKREPKTIYLFIHLLKIRLAVWQVRQQQNTMPPARLNSTPDKKNL